MGEGKRISEATEKMGSNGAAQQSGATLHEGTHEQDEIQVRELTSSETSPTESQRIPVLKTYKLYIGGKFPRTESGRHSLLRNAQGEVIANISHASRKDFREAVCAARGAFHDWSQRSAYNRGQILYRIAEILEGRSEQFVAELVLQGVTKEEAQREVTTSVDRLVYYAGWCDKYQQIFSAVNPVASAHFNFSLLEPMGVIALVAPQAPSLLGLISVMAPCLAGGNTVVVLASEAHPLGSISAAEVLETSDVPGGVVNVLTGFAEELLPHFSSHMDVNALVLARSLDQELQRSAELAAADNMKRLLFWQQDCWADYASQSPYFIRDTQETKTTWHPNK